MADKKKKYTSPYKTIHKIKSFEKEYPSGKVIDISETGFGDSEKMKTGNITETVSQTHDRKKGTTTEKYATRDKSGNITTKIKMKVPAEEMHFKKSKGPMLTQSNRNDKRKITYDA